VQRAPGSSCTERASIVCASAGASSLMETKKAPVLDLSTAVRFSVCTVVVSMCACMFCCACVRVCQVVRGAVGHALAATAMELCSSSSSSSSSGVKLRSSVFAAVQSLPCSCCRCCVSSLCLQLKHWICVSGALKTVAISRCQKCCCCISK
jgi:hypothetical protein